MRSLRAALLVSLSLWFLAPIDARAEVCTVGKAVTAFATIGDALSKNHCTEIRVPPGIYTEPLRISRSVAITNLEPERGAITIQVYQGSALVIETASARSVVRVEDFVLLTSSRTSPALQVKRGDLDAKHVSISNTAGTGISVDHEGTLRLAYSRVWDNAGHGIEVNGGSVTIGATTSFSKNGKGKHLVEGGGLLRDIATEVRPGKLVVAVLGGTCDFVVDGVRHAAGSSLTLELAPGPHVIECLRTGAPKKTRDVVIKSEETAMAMFKLE